MRWHAYRWYLSDVSSIVRTLHLKQSRLRGAVAINVRSVGRSLKLSHVDHGWVTGMEDRISTAVVGLTGRKNELTKQPIITQFKQLYESWLRLHWVRLSVNKQYCL